jgi:eukaryotic-like serine/threonine-protein kinase
MPIHLICLNSGCGQRLEFEDSLAGTHATCMNCFGEVTVPKPGTMVGRLVGDYLVMELLGAGGAGKVYQVRDLTNDRLVALKILNPQLAMDELLVKRFEREARVTAMLDHPNIVRGYGLQRVDKHVCLLMELVIGETVRERLIRKGRLAEKETLNIALAVVRALNHACESGIVHRDVKPANILVRTDGEIKLVDFGLVRMENATMMLTQGAFSIGTPLYSPPEQNEDARNVDHRSDIYALGVTLMHLLTGEHPFAGPSLHMIIHTHATQSMPSGADLGHPLSVGLEAMLQKMTAKPPGQRYQDYESLEAAILSLRES